MKIKHNNAYAALVILVLITIIFIGMYVMIPVHAKFYNMFMNESEFIGLNEEQCDNSQGYWDDSDMECQPLNDRAMQTIDFNKSVWLLAPFIFVAGLIFWLISVALKDDPQEGYLR